MTRIGVELQPDAIDRLLKSGHFLIVQRFGLGQAFMHRARIAVHAVNQEFIVQVRSGGVAGGAHPADNLTLLYPCAFLYSPLVQVQVFGDVGLAVLNKHVVAIALAEAGCGDAAIAGGVNRRAAGRCVVDAAVGAGDLMNRVQSFQVEVGADAGEVQRCPQKGLAHANAVGAVVADVTIGIFVAVGLMVIATPNDLHAPLARRHSSS